MTSPTGTEVGLAYVGVVPSLGHIHESVATGGREAAKIYSDAFRLESVKTMTTASAAIAQALSTVLKPKMAAAGLEAGKAYGTGLASGVKAAQAEVVASLGVTDAAFKAHRRSIDDVAAASVSARGAITEHAKAIEDSGKAAETATGHVGRLGTTLADLKTHFSGTTSEGGGFKASLRSMGDEAKSAGGHLKGVGESAVGMASKMAGAALSPLGLGVALAGTSAIAIEVTRHLVELGDTYENIERIFATQSAAIGGQMEGLEGIVGSVGAKSSSSLEQISSTVARLSSLTHGLSGGDLNQLTTDISDLQVMLGKPINTEQLVGAAHALGVEDKDLDAFVNRLFNVSRVTGVSMDEMTEQIRKSGFALREMNIPADVAVGLLARMDAQGIPTTGMMRAFGATAKQAGKDHIGFNEELVKQVKHLEDLDKTYGHAAAQDYASKVFGSKGALSVMAAFDAGILSSASLTTALNAPKDSIQDVFDKTKNLGDQFGILKNVISTALAPVGIAISHSIGGGLQSASDWVKIHGDVIVGWFKKIVDGAITAGESVLKAFAPVMEMVGKMEVAYGNVFNDPEAKQAGLDLENAAKGMTKPGGIIDTLEQAKHKSDDFFTSLKQGTAVGQLFDDSLDPGGDKGLHVKDKSPHTQDDLDRLKGYGVEVSGDENRLTIKTKIKTDLPPEEKAKVDKEISDLVKDGVKAVPGKDGEISLTADSASNKQKIVDFVREQAGKNLQIPVEMVPTMGPLPPGAPGAPGDNPNRHSTGGRPAPKSPWDKYGPGALWDDGLNWARGNLGAHGQPPGGPQHPPGRPDLTIVGGQAGFTVPGDWYPGRDTVPAMLMPGEEVIRRDAAIRFRPLLKQINSGNVRGYAGGDTVGGNVFGIPLPDPNAPGAPAGGWSSKTTQHDQAWQDQQTAAARATEHASDRVEDLGDQISQYRDELATATAALNDPTNTPAETAAAQKDYNKALRELTRAIRDHGEAQQDLTTAQRKQVEARDKPPESSEGGKGGGEDLGKGFIKGAFQELGLPDVFGEAFTNFGIWKTGMAALGDLFNILKAKGVLGPGATGPGSASSLPTVTLPTDQSRGGITIGPLGSAAQYGPAPGGSVVVPLLPTGTDHLPGGPGAAGPGGPAPGGGGQPHHPWFLPGLGGSGQGADGGQGAGPALGPGGADGGGASTYGPPPTGNTIAYSVPQGASQVQLASAIYSRVVGAGYSPATGQAAVAAGLYESGLNPDITNASQHHGIFQQSADKPSQTGADQQISWLLSELAAQGGPGVFNADPANAIADRVERGGYSGSKYNLGAAASLLSAASGGGSAGFGFPSGAVPTVQTTAFTGAPGDPVAHDTATSGLPRYGGIPGSPSGEGQPIVPWLESQVQQYNQATGSNLSISADYPGGPHGHPDDGGDHSARRAVDVSGSTAQMDAFANYWANNPNLRQSTRQLIHQGPGFADASNVFGGQNRSGQGIYGGDTMAGHGDHVHIAMEDIPGLMGQMTPPQPLQPYGGSTPPGQSGSGQQPQQAQLAGYDTSDLPGDLGLPGSKPYQHGDTGIFGLAGSFISSLPGGNKFMHPFRAGGAASGGVPSVSLPASPPLPSPPPQSQVPSVGFVSSVRSDPNSPSAMPAAMRTRSPDLEHVGAGHGATHTHNTINATFTGVTSDAKIAPRLTSAQVDQSRATPSRTMV
jgi:hypothetical protein